MNTYLLLRDNHETGPHTLEELKALSLRNLDLIWVEGESEHWDYATEFSELKPFITLSIPNLGRKVSHVAPPKYLQNRAPLLQVTTPQTILGTQGETEPAGFALRRNTATTFSAVQERTAEPASFKFKPRKSRNGSLWILSLLLMLMFGAFIVKKMVDDRTQQAIVQSAFIALAKEEKEDKASSALTFQHAISTERVAVSTNKAAKKLDLEAIKIQVRLANNDYKVKLLGGANDLQINVTNGSSETLQTVDLEIKYLKRNGKVLRTENHSVYALGPHATKTLVVPPTKRGVKVAYKVSNVSLKSPKIFVAKA